MKMQTRITAESEYDFSPENHCTDVQWSTPSVVPPESYFDADMYMAVLLQTTGFDMQAPQDWMPDAVYNAMAFAEANDLAMFTGTPEYAAALAQAGRMNFAPVEIVGTSGGCDSFLFHPI